MGGVVDSIESLISEIWDAIQIIWDDVVMPILEEVFSWFGIEDENILVVGRNCVNLYDLQDTDLFNMAKIDAVIKFTKNDISFFNNYLNEVYKLRGRIRSSYNYYDNTLGLAEQFIRANEYVESELDTALIAEFGSLPSVVRVYSSTPRPEEYIKLSLQDNPLYDYKDHLNTLTYDNVWGESFDDWVIDDFVFNSVPIDWSVNISRVAQRAIFWIEGQSTVAEGENATYKIFCNRTIPSGLTGTINFSYTGTAVDGTDYTQVSSVDMLAGDNEVDLIIPILETIGDTGTRDFTVTIDNIDGSNHMFEDIHILPGDDFINTTIIEDDNFVLTLEDVSVNENEVFAIVTVTCHTGNGGTPFTVDYDFTDITAVGGIDYNNTGGTLNFNGNDGDTANIVVGIIDNDSVGEVYETFQINLLNPSPTAGSPDLTKKGIVTIRDGVKADPLATTILQETITEPNPTLEQSLVTRYYFGNIDDTKIWIYPYSDGTYGNIRPSRRQINNLDLMPFYTLRYNSLNANVNTSSITYRRTKYALRLLGLNVDDLIDSIDDPSNPDRASLRTATLVFSMCPTVDQNPVLSKLLWMHWHWIIVEQSLQSNLQSYSAVAKKGANTVNGTIDYIMGWTSHSFLENVPGVVADENTYTHFVFLDDLFIRFQRTATTFDELRISNLHCSTGSYVNFLGVENYEVAPSNLQDEAFSMLVSKFFLDQLTIEELLEVYPYILRIDVFAAEVQEVAWYLTDAFLTLVKVVIIVISIFTLGSTSSLLAVIEAIAINYLVGELILVVAKFIAKETGNEELALAVAAVAYAAFATGGSFNFSMIDASTLTKMVTDFAELFTELELLEQDRIQEDLDRLEEEYEARVDSIEEARGKIQGNDISRLSAYLLSPDSYQIQAIAAQYSFDEIFNYDTLVANFHSNNLRVGVV